METNWNTMRQNIDNELECIWRQYRTEEDNSPLYPEEVLPNSILFLSLNPSVGKNTRTGFKPATWKMDFNVSFKNSCEKPHHPHHHFKKFFDLKNLINYDKYKYTYMDLLYWQKTKQEEVNSKMNEHFIIEQSKLTISIIKKIKPRLVIVCNNLAGRIMYEYRNEIKFTPILENEVYHLDKIPFIIEQSKFMGNPRVSLGSKNIKTQEKFKELKHEIEKILKRTENWFK